MQYLFSSYSEKLVQMAEETPAEKEIKKHEGE